MNSKLFRTSILCVVAVLVAGCSQPEQASQPVEEATAEATAPAEAMLIPRANLFGNPIRTQARISPDGQQVSWLAPVDGVLNIWVAPVDDLDAARAVTNDTGRGIPVHFWTYDGKHVLYQQDEGGNENHHVYAVELATAEVRDLTPVDEISRATIEAVSRFRPNTVLVGLNDRNPQLFDLYEVDISSGERKLVMENPGFAAWVIDHELTPRLGLQQRPGGGMELVQPDGQGGWESFMTIPAEDVLTTNLIGFDADNTHVYGVDSRGRDTTALVRISLVDGATVVLAEDSRADISNALVDPATFEVEAYAVNYTRVEWHPLSEAASKDLARLQEAVPGDLSFLAATEDGRQLIVFANAPERPGTYYLYNRDTGAVRTLFDTRPELAEAPLQPMHPLELEARDGLTLISYLTLPPGSDSDGNGRPDAPVPMVLAVHGGPWGRDAYGYSTFHQWLANRGYAVLSVNYRGSTGFGKGFVNAAVNEFAGKMHDDLVDAVAWAVTEKITQRDQVAILGGSYGGYATLVGVTFTPDTFACGVDLVGPSSLVTLVESFPPYWAPMLESTWFKFVGNPANEAERADMYNRSPISRVNDIRVPLLIGQGENDPRVTKLESDQLVAAMNERDLPVTYLNYPDEGHGFARPENRMSFFAVAEAFLAECLGGRFEAIGDDFDGSSVEVLHGAGYVPGLEAELTEETTGE